MSFYEVILSDIAKIQVGYQARGKIEENLDGPYTIVRPQDFNDDGKLVINQAMRFFPSPKIDAQNYLIAIGDILVQARGQNHNAYLIENPLEATVASNSFYIILIKEDASVIPAYLAWWINQPKVQTYFNREQGLSTIPFISKSVLLKTPVTVPPLEIQKKVNTLIALWRREQGFIQQLTLKNEYLIHAVARKTIQNSLEDR